MTDIRAGFTMAEGGVIIESLVVEIEASAGGILIQRLRDPQTRKIIASLIYEPLYAGRLVGDINMELTGNRLGRRL